MDHVLDVTATIPFLSAFTDAGIGIALIAPEGHWLQVNNALCTITGYSAAELLALTLQVITHPTDLATDLVEMRRLLAGEISTYHLEKRCLHKQGNLIWILLTMSSVRDPNGQMRYSIAQVQDMTARKQAELALQSSERLLVQLQEALTVGIFVLDAAGRPCYVNAAAKQLLGQGVSGETGPDQLAEVYQAFVAGTNQPYPADRMPIVRALAGEYSSVDDMEVRPPGTAILLEVQGTPIFDAAGKLVHAVAAFTDITARKQAETVLHRRLEELHERTQELTLLGELTETIQTCQTVDEAYAVIAAAMPPLFPYEAGGLAVFKASQNVLETSATWGTGSLQTVFTPDKCWALRHGRAVRQDRRHSSVRCTHLDDTLQGTTLCVPMIARSTTLGVFSLWHTAPDGLSAAKERLAHTVASQLGLVLANLKLQETLRHQSIRDPLTGLFNRRYLEESLERELHLARRNRQPVGTLMLDIDHYKRFNDTYGHAAGDALLRTFGHLLRRYIRSEDIACRYGGEEFCLVLPGLTAEVALRRAEEIRAAVADLHVQHLNQLLGHITCSIGVAIFPQDGLSLSEVIEAADQALYRAKGAGRDRVMLAAGSLSL